jgi:glycosyltransferase involved in cell wall biosynthesis
MGRYEMSGAEGPGVAVSIIIPVYNSADILPHLAEELLDFVHGRREPFEILLVVDGSPDASWEETRRVCTEAPDIFRGLRLSRNFGQQNATLCGMRFARGRILVTMDDDLQHRPADIARLLDALEFQGADAVVARLVGKKHALGRRVASWVIRLLNERLLQKPKGLHLSSFRAMRREVGEAILEIRTAYPYFPALLFAVTHNVVNVDLPHYPRSGGRSNYNLTSMMVLASKLILNNSSVLLDLLGLVGALAASASFLGAATVAAKKLLYGVPAPGWASLMVSLYLIGGLLLMGMGILGKYLLRILGETSRQPPYFVSQRTDGGP